MNKLTFIFCGACVGLSILASVFFYVKGKIELKKEQKKQQEQEKKNDKINKETIENINAVVIDDVHAGNNVLHELAQKRK